MSEEITNKPIDEFDLALIRELEIDARKSYLDMATKLGASHTTVRRRLQSLLDNEIISFITIADPKAMGYLTQVVLGINTRPDTVDAVANQLGSLGCVQGVIATAGRYDIMGMIVIKDLEDLANFISRDLSAIEGITYVDTMIVLKAFKWDWPYEGGKDYPIPRNPNRINPDKLDFALIRELELQPRETISQLAKTLGVSRTVVSKKMQSLLEERIISVVSVPNLSALGYKVWMVLHIKVDPSRLYEVAETLSRYSNVTHVIMFTGRFDLSVAALFKDRNDMHDFTVNKLGKVSGIIRQETLINLKRYKRSFSLLSHHHAQHVPKK